MRVAVYLSSATKVKSNYSTIFTCILRNINVKLLLIIISTKHMTVFLNKCLSLTEFDGRTVSYGPSFFFLNL